MAQTTIKKIGDFETKIEKSATFTAKLKVTLPASERPERERDRKDFTGPK